ncbi:MAG: PspC domain-containing protein [Rhodocyclaceae bacterium]|nr:MAG: PspC domain-containing protein [Rhodocyclaceae bacterium]
MTLADDLIKLEQLRDRGTLTNEEFARAKSRLLDPPLAAVPGVAAFNRFRRSQTDRWLGGICGGLALSTGLESWFWRLLFTLLLFLGGTGLLVYVVLWIFVPAE